MTAPKLHFRETDGPVVPDICGSAVDLVKPETAGSKNISLAIVYVEPGKSSTPHYHKITEEIYYFLEGNGRVVVGNETFNVSPGSTVYIPLHKMHHIVNDGKTRLKLLSADSPPYDTADIFSK